MKRKKPVIYPKKTREEEISEIADIIKNTEKIATEIVGASPSYKMLAQDIYDKGWRYKNSFISEVLDDIFELMDICSEEEYSEQYGFAPKKWFNMGKFKRRLNKLRVEYTETK